MPTPGDEPEPTEIAMSRSKDCTWWFSLTMESGGYAIGHTASFSRFSAEASEGEDCRLMLNWEVSCIFGFVCHAGILSSQSAPKDCQNTHGLLQREQDMQIALIPRLGSVSPHGKQCRCSVKKAGDGLIKFQ
jgi:hypothetical protein